MNLTNFHQFVAIKIFHIVSYLTYQWWICCNLALIYRRTGNFGVVKLWRNLIKGILAKETSAKCWQRRLFCLLALLWKVKVWRFGPNSPNSSKFPLAKVSDFMVPETKLYQWGTSEDSSLHCHCTRITMVSNWYIPSIFMNVITSNNWVNSEWIFCTSSLT